MPREKISLHDRTAEIQISIPETKVLIDFNAVLDWKRGRLRLVKDRQFRTCDIDVSCGNFRIRSPFGAVLDRPGDRDDKFRSETLSKLVCNLAMLRCEDNLRLAIAVPQIDENHSTEVTAHIDPACQRYRRADVGFSQSPA